MSIKRWMEIVFGTGDVIVTLMRHENLVDAVAFYEQDKGRPIGNLEKGVELKMEDTDLVLRFTDPASVDVVIQALRMVKENLIKAARVGDQDQCDTDDEEMKR